MRYALVFVLTIPLSLRAAHGAQAWAVDSNSPGGHGDAVVKFDTSNPAGTIQVVGHTEVTGFFMSGLDFDGLGNLFAVSQVSGAGTASGSLYKIDQADGHATLVGNLGLAA
jgi:hypothetical protein